MTTSAFPPSLTAAEAVPVEPVRTKRAAVPWVVPATLIASTCIVVGLIWDISWHRTIGRDTFWSPPHVVEQLAAIIAGLSCGWLVLRTTFAGSESDRAATVRFWGFRGPLGAWVCIWGTIMMIASAPFDNWWHNAYGLDVKIISPPHMVLAMGMIALELGALLIAVAAQNRGENDRRLSLMYAYAAGVIVCMAATVIMEDASFPNHMHGSFFYQATGLLFPFFLVTFARASRLRWPATTISAIYLAIVLPIMWILQLFPATAKLAPIYNPVTHMVPPPFPLLLIVPAVVLDLILRRTKSGEWNDWKSAILLGAGFVAVFFVTQWFFADFLLSPAARNIVFAADQWDYNVRLGNWRYLYWNLDVDSAWRPGLETAEHFSPTKLALGLGIATILAILSARFGLKCGKLLERVKR